MMNLKCHLIKLNLENYSIFLHEDWDEYYHSVPKSSTVR